MYHLRIICGIVFCQALLFFFCVSLLKPKVLEAMIVIGLTDMEKRLYSVYFCFMLPVISIFWLLTSELNLNQGIFVIFTAPTLSILLDLFVIDFLSFIISIASPPRFHVFLYLRGCFHFFIHLQNLNEFMVLEKPFVSLLLPIFFVIYSLFMVYRIPSIFIINHTDLQNKQTHLIKTDQIDSYNQLRWELNSRLRKKVEVREIAQDQKERETFLHHHSHSENNA